jgi:hypothetical protein
VASQRWRAAMEYYVGLYDLSLEFGLTPVARTRLAAGGYAPPGKFDRLLR